MHTDTHTHKKTMTPNKKGGNFVRNFWNLDTLLHFVYMVQLVACFKILEEEGMGERRSLMQKPGYSPKR